MDTVRVRLGSVVEWLVAAGFLTATVAVGSLILHDMRVPAVRASAAAERAPGPVAETPPSIPAAAVSVPVLPFRDGSEIRVGDTALAVATRLGRSAETGGQTVDRGRFGERLTRFYEYGGFRFLVVYEPFERNGEMRVGSIYLP